MLGESGVCGNYVSLFMLIVSFCLFVVGVVIEYKRVLALPLYGQVLIIESLSLISFLK